MQQYDRLKTLYSVISVLMLFTVIAASRPANKNVRTGAVINPNQVQNFWQTIKPVLVTSLGVPTAGT